MNYELEGEPGDESVKLEKGTRVPLPGDIVRFATPTWTYGACSLPTSGGTVWSVNRERGATRERNLA